MAKLAPARPCGVRRHDAALALGDMSPSGSRPPARPVWGRPRPRIPKHWAGTRPPAPSQKPRQSNQIKPNQTKSNQIKPPPLFAAFAVPRCLSDLRNPKSAPIKAKTPAIKANRASSRQTPKLFIALPPLAAIFNLAFSVQPLAFSFPPQQSCLIKANQGIRKKAPSWPRPRNLPRASPSVIGSWAFGVGCWMFTPVRLSRFPSPECPIHHRVFVTSRLDMNRPFMFTYASIL